jgi:hypothetical protein
MMTKEKAMKTGSRYGLVSVGIGLLVANLFMMLFTSGEGLLKGFFWFLTVEYRFNILVGVVIMLLAGHLSGQIAGKLILLKKKDHTSVGIISGLAVLIITALLCGWTGFFEEGVDKIGSDDDPFEDYIFKPAFWISVVGFIPAVLVGAWFGWRIKKLADTSATAVSS